MKNYFKRSQIRIAIVAVSLIIIGGAVFVIVNGQNSKQQPMHVVSTAAKKESTAGRTKGATTTVPEATTSTAPADSNTTAVGSTSTAKKATTAATSVSTKTAAPATTQVAAPVVTPQPVNKPCEVNGRVAVPVGGISCSREISSPNGLSTQWYLPMLYSFTDGTGSVEKPLAPVYVVVETRSETATGPFTASKITFHYSALASAPVGDYNDGSNGLAFYIMSTGNSLTLPVTVTN